MKSIKHYLKEYSYLKSIQALQHWDMETQMPKGAIIDRAERMAYVEGKLHQHLTSSTYKKMLLEFSKKKKNKLEEKLYQELKWDFELKNKLPAKFVHDLSHATSHANHAWQHAKKENDWKSYVPHLKKVIQLKKQEGRFYNKSNPYAGLFKTFEKELSLEQVSAIFTELKEGLQTIIRKIPARREILLQGPFDIEKQKLLNVEIKNLIGLTDHFSRLDISTHPFSTNISPNDHRITSRYVEHDFQSLYSTIHEVGHSLYELNLPAKKWEGTPFQEALSLTVHESQSRFWENIIGRSRPFAKLLLPKLKVLFPKSEIKNWSSEQLFVYLNDINPGYIRVDSCELYYNFHVIIRFEIEKLIFSGNAKVEELPEIWNEKYKEYLGLTPPTYALGILQDSHWAGGAFGYFPTYTLGNLLSATLWKDLQANILDCDGQIERGEFSRILNYLVKHVHEHGRMISLKTLAPNFGPKDYLEYLEKKLINTSLAHRR
jgi:carboxypeptidase Taq